MIRQAVSGGGLLMICFRWETQIPCNIVAWDTLKSTMGLIPRNLYANDICYGFRL